VFGLKLNNSSIPANFNSLMAGRAC